MVIINYNATKCVILSVFIINFYPKLEHLTRMVPCIVECNNKLERERNVMLAFKFACFLEGVSFYTNQCVHVHVCEETKIG